MLPLLCSNIFTARCYDALRARLCHSRSSVHPSVCDV